MERKTITILAITAIAALLLLVYLPLFLIGAIIGFIISPFLLPHLKKILPPNPKDIRIAELEAEVRKLKKQQTNIEKSS